MNFEALWREADEREKREEDSQRQVRLQCNGEFVGIGEIDLNVLRESLGTELIEFVCPRCAWRHESPLFP